MKVKRYLLPILLLLLDSTPQTYSQSKETEAPPGCYALSSSKYCGGSYGNYYLSNKMLIDGNVVTNAVALDRAMEYYFGSPQDIMRISSYFNCNPLSTWDGVYFPPFRSLFYCRTLLENPLSKTCNLNNPVPPTCLTDCVANVKQWEFLWGNQTLCKSPGDLETKRATITQGWCGSFPFNGTQTDCVQPKDSPDTVCGYSLTLDRTAFCIYCANNPQAACCNSDSGRSCISNNNTSRKQLILILPIVLGCLGMIGLVAGLWYYFKKKRQHTQITGSIDNLNPSTSPSDTRSPTIDTDHMASLPSVYTCIYPYEPILPDELHILPNDRVAILMSFEDGWGVGRNLTRGGEGALPLACLDKPKALSEETVYSRTSNSSIPRRTASKRDSGNTRISHYSIR
ncbi:hypothetical protein K493DRAFT_303932 [Basidiobolus meristosporus CBS 931.73]|uniref:SH3 domain-containing protein n=1 Tax=Basidiobolus meristosporus CBS 931.73 TaxID=1314790 RepID=A0A1Y1Y0T8_9FUNG|nr:hypothetical protein K493DRAFT_303932 [Basidiobolus meristosporus CBS 931.73]|eukprot:ORX91610.1 hypothetical protein K493DRAFT_303932 [Basidiobolus meristosporus CBS 931.73]